MLKRKKKRLKQFIALFTFNLLAFGMTVGAEAVAGETIKLNFDVNQMFTWTQAIIDSLMPVVYVTLGISLGFLIIRALKGAFR